MIPRVVMIPVFVVGIVGLSSGPVFGQKGKAPEWTHGLELRARKADEKEFSDKTRGFGGEAYLNPTTNSLMYVMETGSLTSLPAAGFTPPKDIKGPKWLTGMNLAARKAGEKDFTDNTKKYGVEVFQDENSGGRIYISETGSVAEIRGAAASASTAGPKHQYGYELRVRKGTEPDFNDATKRYGLEVFRDEAGGTLIYISETGAIAVVPAGTITGGGEAKNPAWMFGLNLRVRKAGEKDTTDATRKWGIEVFKDEKAGNLIFINENGDLAVAPAGSFKQPEMVKNATWLAAAEVRVRRVGEQAFEKAKQWGIEIFRDENTGNMITIAESGALAVTPK
jgi:hypothetical protein